MRALHKRRAGQFIDPPRSLSLSQTREQDSCLCGANKLGNLLSFLLDTACQARSTRDSWRRRRCRIGIEVKEGCRLIVRKPGDHWLTPPAVVFRVSLTHRNSSFCEASVPAPGERERLGKDQTHLLCHQSLLEPLRQVREGGDVVCNWTEEAAERARVGLAHFL